MKKISTILLIDIRFNEIDLYHVVWNGHYLGYLELARQKLLDEYRLDYATLLGMGFLIPLSHVEVDFKKAIRYSDKQVEVCVSLNDSLVPRFQFDYVIRSLDRKTVFCTGRTDHVLVENHNWNLRMTYPEALRQWRSEMFSTVE
jgi:acyl-CoA thioester hydrolase